MHIREALEKYAFACKGLSEHTQLWYKKRLAKFCTWCELHGYQLEQVSPQIIRAYIDELSVKPHHQTGKKLSTYTVHGHARILRAFYGWLAREEEFEDLVSRKVGRKIPMPRIDRKVIEIFSIDEIKALFAACEQSSIHPAMIARNKAILAVLLDTGIRAGELSGLTLDHCYLDPRDAYIKVMGKGSKEREISLGNKSLAALQEYLLLRIAPPGEPHVFLTHAHKPFSTNNNTLNQVLYHLAGIAGVNDCHAHKFRHTFACSYLTLKAGDIYMLKVLMGHSSIHVTQIYVQTIQAHQARHLSKSVFDEL